MPSEGPPSPSPGLSLPLRRAGGECRGRGFGREDPEATGDTAAAPGTWALGTALLPPPPITPVPSLSYRPPHVGPGTSVASPACAQEKTQNKGFLTALPPPPSLGPEPRQEKGLPLLNQTLNSWEQEVKMTFTSHSRESRSCYFTDSHTHTHVPYKSRPRTSPVDPAPPEAPRGALLHMAAPWRAGLAALRDALLCASWSPSSPRHSINDLPETARAVFFSSPLAWDPPRPPQRLPHSQGAFSQRGPTVSQGWSQQPRPRRGRDRIWRFVERKMNQGALIRCDRFSGE